MGDGLVTAAVFVDLTKAFDTVKQSVNKKITGVGNHRNRLTMVYFISRLQTTCLLQWNSVVSTNSQVKSATRVSPRSITISGVY